MNKSTTVIAMVGTLAISLAFTACESGPKGQETETVAVTPDAAIAVDTFTTTATVTAIDASNRKLTLTGPGGSRTTCKAGRDVVNFDQIRVGDQVKATVTEEYAILLSRGASLSASGGQTVALTPVGAKPGMYVADVAQATARVEAVNPQHRKVTLQFVDGRSKTVKVGKDIDLSGLRVGDDVTVQVAESIAIAVEKP